MSGFEGWDLVVGEKRYPLIEPVTYTLDECALFKQRAGISVFDIPMAIFGYEADAMKVAVYVHSQRAGDELSWDEIGAMPIGTVRLDQPEPTPGEGDADPPVDPAPATSGAGEPNPESTS